MIKQLNFLQPILCTIIFFPIVFSVHMIHCQDDNVSSLIASNQTTYFPWRNPFKTPTFTSLAQLPLKGVQKISHWVQENPETAYCAAGIAVTAFAAAWYYTNQRKYADPIFAPLRNEEQIDLENQSEVSQAEQRALTEWCNAQKQSSPASVTALFLMCIAKVTKAKNENNIETEKCVKEQINTSNAGGDSQVHQQGFFCFPYLPKEIKIEILMRAYPEVFTSRISYGISHQFFDNFRRQEISPAMPFTMTGTVPGCSISFDTMLTTCSSNPWHLVIKKKKPHSRQTESIILLNNDRRKEKDKIMFQWERINNNKFVLIVTQTEKNQYKFSFCDAQDQSSGGQLKEEDKSRINDLRFSANNLDRTDIQLSERLLNQYSWPSTNQSVQAHNDANKEEQSRDLFEEPKDDLVLALHQEKPEWAFVKNDTFVIGDSSNGMIEMAKPFVDGTEKQEPLRLKTLEYVNLAGSNSKQQHLLGIDPSGNVHLLTCNKEKKSVESFPLVLVDKNGKVCDNVVAFAQHRTDPEQIVFLQESDNTHQYGNQQVPLFNVFIGRFKNNSNGQICITQCKLIKKEISLFDTSWKMYRREVEFSGFKAKIQIAFNSTGIMCMFDKRLMMEFPKGAFDHKIKNGSSNVGVPFAFISSPFKNITIPDRYGVED